MESTTPSPNLVAMRRAAATITSLKSDGRHNTIRKVHIIYNRSSSVINKHGNDK